ncbi:uncharacterized protein LOC129855231 isoform X1 [Salvelinus fontinalis]|uniref:uncharacterized protein LOC129855231 isoform X1 n=2 Tax=Salvelinus fontinalis TaxID=8038 RepID=UPI0024852932|nr:uncharacterized protein LOC129855231 isoform X1 [Salvelinus fontinalis]
MSYSYPAKVNVPPGLRTLLEGLSRAVVKRRPDYISQFAQLYFAELLRFRTENPTLDIKALVREFNATKVPKLPSHGIGTVIAPLAVQNESATAVSSGGPYVQPCGVYPPVRIFPTLPSIPGVEEQGAEQPWIHSQDILYTVSTLPGLSDSNEASEVTSLASQYLNDNGLQSLLQTVISNVSPHPISAEQTDDVVVFRRKSSTDCMTADCDINSAASDRTRRTESALFERVPLSEIDLISNAVLIRTPSVPCEYMIVVQSDNVPETIVFQRDSSVSKKMRNARAAAGGAATGAPGNAQSDCTPCLTLPTAPSQMVKDQPATKLVTPLVVTEDPQLFGGGNRAVLTQLGWNPLSPGDNFFYKHMDINTAFPDANAYNPYMNEMIVDEMNEVNFGILPKVSDEMTCFNVMGPPTFMPPRVSAAEEISASSLVYPQISAGQEANTLCLVLPTISIAQESGALPLLSPPSISMPQAITVPSGMCPAISQPEEIKTSKAEEIEAVRSMYPPIVPPSLPNPSVPAPQETTATLLHPPFLAQVETRPTSLPHPQAPVAHMHQCTGQNALAFHVNEESRRTPYMIPLVSQSIMGVTQMYVQPQQPQFIHSWSREADSQRPCDTAPTAAMPEFQYVRPEACGSSWRLCHLARPEFMAGMPTAVACPGGSRTVIGHGQEQGYLPDQANLPMHQDFGPRFIHMCGANLFQTLCPMSGAYMPVKPPDHRCCQAAPDVVLPHYALINSPTHGVASYLCPTPLSMQPQGFAYDSVHMYGPHSETVNAMASTFNVSSHAVPQQGTTEHCREPSNMPMGENPNEQNYSGI